MADTGFVYSIDSSAFIHGWVRAYPPDIFAPVWQRVDGLIEAGRLLSSIEVLNEIKKKEDTLYEWCTARQQMFVELDDPTQIKLAAIMGKYPRLVDTAKGKSGADPVVIALAMAHFPPLTVVSEERGGSDNRPKIPFVCQQEDIRCITLLQLIQEQGWRF